MKTPDEMQEDWEEEIEKAGVATEEQMRDAEVPWPKSQKELVSYISSLVERPHSYGTCVYAMSMAAAATYFYVSHKLGVSGFQASCADMDFLRITRRFEWGKILDYSDLLYPQNCNSEKFPSHRDLLADPKIIKGLAERAQQELIKTDGNVHPNVKEHWETLIANAEDQSKS